MCVAWTDTHHQPGDGGTRPDEKGRLSLERPTWVCAKLLVEIFSGSARLTSAAHAHEFFRDRTAEPWDVINGEQFNLMIRGNFKRLLSFLASGHVVFGWLGTPCTTFTRARRWDGGPPPLRDPEDISRPAPWIWREGDLRAIREGNRLADVSAQCILVMFRARAHYVLENGHRTHLWNARRSAPL